MANLRAAKRETTRRLLLDAAMERFVSRGYAATTIDEIASAAGTTRVTFYAYFPSKSEIVKALIAERFESGPIAPGLVDAVADGTRENLGAWISEAAARWPAVRPIITIGRAAGAVAPELAHLVDAWMEDAIEDVAAGLAKADRFDTDSRRFLAALAVAQFDYVSQRWTAGAWGVDHEQMCELLTESWSKLLTE